MAEHWSGLVSFACGDHGDPPTVLPNTPDNTRTAGGQPPQQYIKGGWFGGAAFEGGPSAKRPLRLRWLTSLAQPALARHWRAVGGLGPDKELAINVQPGF